MLSVPLSNSDKLLCIAASFCLYWLLFFIAPFACFLTPQERQLLRTTQLQRQPLPPSLRSRRIVIQNYLMSTLHAIIGIVAVTVFLLSFNIQIRDVRHMYIGGPDVFFTGGGDEYMYYFTCGSVGYFLYDLTCMLSFPVIVPSVSSYIHHVVIGAAFLMSIFSNVCHAFHFLLLFEELSTPFLNLKSLLKHHSSLSQLCSILFALTFFLSRILFGTCWLFGNGFAIYPEFLRLSSANFGVIVNGSSQIAMGLLTRVLNLYWLVLIAKKLVQAFTGGSKNKKKHAQTTTTTPTQQVVPAASSPPTSDKGDGIDTEDDQDNLKLE